MLAKTVDPAWPVHPNVPHLNKEIPRIIVCKLKTHKTTQLR